MNNLITQQPLSESSTLSRVDVLVRNILTKKLTIELIIEELNQIYYPFSQIFNDEDFEYVKTIHSFFYSTNLIVNHQYPQEVIWNLKNTQAFIHALMYYQNEILLDDFAYQTQEMSNTETLRNYLTQLTTHYQKLLFVRIDLGYLKDKQNEISIEDYHYHIDKLRELISNKQTVFQYLQGHAWALEQGIDKGYHCHLLLIYDGARRQNAWGVAKQVGEKWQKITDSKGTYFNCHDREYLKRYAYLDKISIGMIHRDNPMEVTNAINTALYLTRPNKIEQRLKVKLPHMRTFGTGQYYNSKRRGLPTR